MVEAKEIESRKTEILILGGGVAGLSAAVYASRAGRKTVVLEGRASSRLELGYLVENYPGFISIESTELLRKFKAHAEHFGARVTGDEATVFSLASNPKYVTTRKKLYESKSVIIASGKPVSMERMIPGEDSLLGMGVSYCATCDGPIFRGRKVAVIGDNEEAAEDILALIQMGCEVHWILKGEKSSLSSASVSKVDNKDVPFYENSRVKAIKGEGRVEAVVFEKDRIEEEMRVSGVFIFRETPSASQFSKSGIELDHRQCVAVDRFQRTNLEGVYAAGDVTCGGMQIVTAAGEGAVAAIQAVKYLRQDED